MQVDEDTLALDAIAQVGPGGQFLGSKHTRRHMREVQWRPTLLNRDSRENWVAGGALDLAERARRKALALLAAARGRRRRPSEVAAAADALVDGVRRLDRGARPVSGRGGHGAGRMRVARDARTSSSSATAPRR